MAITQAIPASFRLELAQGLHDFSADTFKIALYSSSASLDENTTAYTTTGEITGTGYVAGGATLTTVAPVLSGSTAIIDFANVTWSSATFTARGALIYNSSESNKAVLVLDFGSDRSVTGTDFTVVFPAADSSNAIIRIA